MKLKSMLSKMALISLWASSILISVEGMNNHDGMCLFSNGSAKIFSKHAQVRGAGAFQMSLRIMCRAYSVDT
jgi:hypothetical protein